MSLGQVTCQICGIKPARTHGVSYSCHCSTTRGPIPIKCDTCAWAVYEAKIRKEHKLEREPAVAAAKPSTAQAPASSNQGSSHNEVLGRKPVIPTSPNQGSSDAYNSPTNSIDTPASSKSEYNADVSSSPGANFSDEDWDSCNREWEDEEIERLTWEAVKHAKNLPVGYKY